MCGKDRSETVPTKSPGRITASSNSEKPANNKVIKRMKPISISCVEKNQMPKLSVRGEGSSKINILKKNREQRTTGDENEISAKNSTFLIESAGPNCDKTNQRDR